MRTFSAPAVCMLDDPVSGDDDIRQMRVQGLDRRDADKIGQFVHKAGLVVVKVV